MSRKSAGFRTLSRESKQRELQLTVESKENRKHESRRSRRVVVMLGVMIVAVCCIGAIAGWRGSQPITMTASMPPSMPANAPSKEYIYAGSSLLATEEAGADTGTTTTPEFTMTATTVSNSTWIKLDWTALSGGTGVDNYQIERSINNSGTFQALFTGIGGSTLTYTDTDTTVNQAYLYRVKAVKTNNGGTAYSNRDAATAIAFDDDPLQQNVTGIKAVHITQLQQAVNAMRELAGLSQISWANSAISGQAITANPLTEIRTALNEAIGNLPITTPQYTDAGYNAGTLIYKRHIEELRQHVK